MLKNKQTNKRKDPQKTSPTKTTKKKKKGKKI